MLASLALGRDDEWSSFPLVRMPRASLPPEPLKRLGGGVIRSALLSVEDAQEQGRRGSVTCAGDRRAAAPPADAARHALTHCATFPRQAGILRSALLCSRPYFVVSPASNLANGNRSSLGP